MVVAIFHAGYKSAIFVLAGAAIAEHASFAETLFTIRKGKMMLAVFPFLNAAGLKNTLYFSGKHTLTSSSALSFSGVLQIFVVFNFLIFWMAVFSLTNSFRVSYATCVFPVVGPALSISSLLLLALSLPATGAVASQETLVISLVISRFLLIKPITRNLNVGSTAFSHRESNFVGVAYPVIGKLTSTGLLATGFTPRAHDFLLIIFMGMVISG